MENEYEFPEIIAEGLRVFGMPAEEVEALKARVTQAPETFAEEVLPAFARLSPGGFEAARAEWRQQMLDNPAEII